jgi:pyridoxamine-phosphate oxidase
MSYDSNSNDYLLPSQDPFEVFDKWFHEVKSKLADDPTVMTLSTVKDGSPKERTVLLKGFDKEHFTFFTNYNSHKGVEIESNPFGALTFFWKSCDYQVRIEGELKKTSREVSSGYFNSRARDSQLASIVSSQSSPIESREKLLEKLDSLKKGTEGKELECPENWGGYELVPDRFIFFIYGKHRINDRFEFVREKDGWNILRLQP